MLCMDMAPLNSIHISTIHVPEREIHSKTSPIQKEQSDTDPKQYWNLKGLSVCIMPLDNSRMRINPELFLDPTGKRRVKCHVRSWTVTICLNTVITQFTDTSVHKHSAFKQKHWTEFYLHSQIPHQETHTTAAIFPTQTNAAILLNLKNKLRYMY